MRELSQNLLTGTSLRQILPNNQSPYKFGGTSSDHFTATPSQDNYFGDAGSDTVNYENSTGRVSVDLMTGQGLGGSAHNDTYNSIENVIGSDFGDSLAGNDASNMLHGGGGDDTFVGSKGNDQLFGGEGDSDTVVYSNNDKAVNADLSAYKVHKGYGNGIDRIEGIEDVVGSNFDDKLTGDENDNMLNGIGGNDTFVGSKGDDTLVGGEGDDDTVDYGRNDQAIRANLARSTVIKGEGNGTDTISGIENVIGSNLDDTITGNYANNTLDGRGGKDTLIGGSGDDTLIGGHGADTLDGGEDVDTASYEDSNAGVRVSLASGTATGGHAEGDTLERIENLIGSDHADVLEGDQNDNVLNGLGGNDTFVGSTGDDTLTGGDGADDTVDYSVNNIGIMADLVDGSVLKRRDPGNDWLNDSDSLSGIENIIGSQYSDSFRGNDEDNSFHGLDGNDSFIGSKGNDELIGGGGRDSIHYNFSSLDQGVNVNLAANSVDKGVGNGVDYVSGIEVVGGTDFDDVIEGTEADEVFWGNGGDDVLSGGAGQDRLIGGVGNDVIDGGDGIDTAHLNYAATRDADGSIRYDNSTEHVSVSLQDGFATTTAGEQDTLINIENVVLEGRVHATIEGSDADNVIEMTEIGYGNDTINGLGGNDTMTGGYGADVFKFENAKSSGSEKNHGKDVITDFTVGVDKIDLSGTEVYGFEDLLNYDPSAPQSEWGDRYMVQEGDNAVIYTFDGAEGDSITLENVNIENLSANDFIFGGSLNEGATVNGASASVDTGDGFGIEGVRDMRFADLMERSEASEFFIGQAGGDTLSAGAGSDTMTDAAGADVFEFSGPDANHGIDFITFDGAEGDTMTDAAGADTLSGRAEDDTVIVGADLSEFSGPDANNGIDFITFDGAEGDTMTDAAGADVFEFSGPDANHGIGVITFDGAEGDTMTDAAGADVFEFSGPDANHGIGVITFDGAEGDTMTDAAGADVFEFSGPDANHGIGVITFDGAEGDTMTDAAGADVFEFSGPDANHGNDVITLDGGFGDDTLSSGAGNDTMTGGYGADVFKFENDKCSGPDENHGKDVITDFMVGVDKIDLSGTEVFGFEDLLNYDSCAPQSEWGDRYMVQEGDDAVIYTIDGAQGDSITLENVNMEELSANDFIF